MSKSMDERMAFLEDRIAGLEDRMAIYQLLATYGPAVDSLSAPTVGGLWTKEGIYDADGKTPYVGNEQIGNLVQGDLHQSFVQQGCGHVMSMPHIVLDGDTAVATGYSRVYVHSGDNWHVKRVSANRWELDRTADGWRVVRRLNRVLNGSEEPRRILGRELESEASGDGA